MAQVVQRASLHTCMVICVLCVCWLSLFAYLLFFSFLSLLFQPFQTPFSAVHKKFMSQSLRSFRSGTVVSNDHETPRTLWCEASAQVCCRLHCWLRSGPRTQRMSLTRCCSGASRKCRLIWTVTRLFYSLVDSVVETTESVFAACCHNCAEIKADVDAQVLSHAERDIWCLGIASSDADGTWVFRGESHVFRLAAI